MKHHSFKTLSLLVASFLLSSTANAAMVTINWTGTIYDYDGISPIPGIIDVGDTIIGNFSYDSNAPLDTGATFPNIFSTNHVSYFALNGFSEQTEGSQVVVYNGPASVGGRPTLGDRLSSTTPNGNSSTGDLIDGRTVKNLRVEFQDPFGGEFTTTTLPTTLDPAAFTIMDGYFDLDKVGEDSLRVNFDVDGFTVTSEVAAVPLPAAVWLMGSALIGLFGFQRKQAGKKVA